MVSIRYLLDIHNAIELSCHRAKRCVHRLLVDALTLVELNKEHKQFKDVLRSIDHLFFGITNALSFGTTALAMLTLALSNVSLIALVSGIFILYTAVAVA